MPCHLPAGKTLWSHDQKTRHHRLPARRTLEGPLTRIVLVEDDDLMREWLGRSLASRGYAVARFARADIAVAAVIADPPHLVLTDVRMPGMSGFEMARALRAGGVRVPVVFMTADPSESVDAEAIEFGSRPVLRKPFHDVAELWAAVETEAARTAGDGRTGLTETSHALRTPLTAVRLAVEGLLADRVLDERERRLAEIASRNLDRLSSAVEDHLSQLAIGDEVTVPLD
jgi:DNA-binding response OmpR family regulator